MRVEPAPELAEAVAAETAPGMGPQQCDGARAAQGKLDGLANLFEILIRSVKLNPGWLGAYKQVMAMLAQGQIQHVHQVSQIGAMYAHMGSGMVQQDLPSWYGRQDIWGRSDQGRSEWSQSVETYSAPQRGA